MAKTKAEDKRKRGPDPERLKIEDPKAALRGLLAFPPPSAEEEPEGDEEPRGG